MASVESKLPPIFVCAHRPLREGEKAKRRGQTTVYEASGEITPGALSLWESPSVVNRVTVKHDGQCSKIIATPTEGVRVYRRLDARKGLKEIPVGLAASPSPPHPLLDGAPAPPAEPQFYWIRVDDTQTADNQYFLSALRFDSGGNLSFISVIVPDSSSPIGYKSDWLPVSSFSSSTWELIGPKIQGNPYQLPLDAVPVKLLQKGNLKEKMLPRHYFVLHGSFEVALPDETPFTLAAMTNFIVSNQLEGVVVHFEVSSDSDEKTDADSGEVTPLTMFKINRGHIGVPVGKGSLKITLS